MPPSLRTVLKGAAERTLIWSGSAWLHRQRMSGRTLVLAYHNIVADGTQPSGDRPNHLPLAEFAKQIAALRETHDVVDLPATLAARPSGRSRPRAAITFDDAYRGALRYGVPELVRQGVPATIFVAPGLLGGRSFWWDALSAQETGLDAAIRTRALGELRGDQAAVTAWATAAKVAHVEMDADRCSASEREVLDAAAAPGITLGSHSWSHPSLDHLRPDELHAELTTPLAWLRERIASPMPWIAYPYGAFSDAVMKASAAAGYSAGLAISGGWFERDQPNRFSLPRVNVPTGMSANGFALRAAGLFCD